MINNLATHSSPPPSSHWKYIDDITISEVSSLGEVSSLQNDIDCISQWAQQNNMNLNPKKCKIMTICPLKNKPVPPMLSINNLPLQTVSSYKVLSLTLCDTLRWNDNTNDIFSKASKQLHILRVLKHAGSLRWTLSPSIAPWFALSQNTLPLSELPAFLTSSLTSQKLSRRGLCELYILTFTINRPLRKPLPVQSIDVPICVSKCGKISKITQPASCTVSSLLCDPNATLTILGTVAVLAVFSINQNALVLVFSQQWQKSTNQQDSGYFLLQYFTHVQIVNNL